MYEIIKHLQAALAMALDRTENLTKINDEYLQEINELRDNLKLSKYLVLKREKMIADQGLLLRIFDETIQPLEGLIDQAIETLKISAPGSAMEILKSALIKIKYVKQEQTELEVKKRGNQ